MKINADHGHRSWKALNGLKPSQPITTTKIALVALLLAGIGFAALAQNFTNLDFEAATMPPVSFSSALPGWTGYNGTNLQTSVNYDWECLDSACMAILDTGAFQ